MPGNIERERRRARERYERQQEVRLARHRRNRKRFGIGIAVLCVLGLIGGLTAAFAAGGSPAPKASAKPTVKHCTYTPSTAGLVKKVSLPPAAASYKAAYTATINTSLGPISVNLLNSKATCAVNSFVHLASAGFWDKTQCHRLSTNGGLYMLQCGDPNASGTRQLSCTSQTLGTGGPGYEFADENLTGATYAAGTVAMANSGANTNGSQFFLVFKKTTLTPSYTPFGTITSGLAILQNVAKAGTSCTYSGAGGGVPKEKVIINSVTIHKS